MQSRRIYTKLYFYTGFYGNSRHATVLVDRARYRTSYDIYVYQMCPDSSISQALGPVNFQTLQCQLSNTCQYDFELTDSFGDGWNGAEIQILNSTGGVEYTLGSSFTTGYSYTETVYLCSGETFAVEVSQAGPYPGEIDLMLALLV